MQVDFDIERVKVDARKLNEGIRIFPISAKTGDGFANWCDWLTESVKSLREAKYFTHCKGRASGEI